MYAGLHFDGRKLLDQIKAPTIIINCKKDQFMPMKITMELARGISGAKLVLLERDHMFIMTEPELVVKSALEFLTEIDGASGVKKVEIAA
jgi:pimeloyl-ACP methyl ester carboxylesterase